MSSQIVDLPNGKPNVARDAWVAPGAILAGAVRVHSGAGIWYAAVLRADSEPITVGLDSNVQDGCVLHTDAGSPLRIGAGVSVGHRAVLHGCTVGDDTLIGMGAIVMNGAQIGRSCLIAAEHDIVVLGGSHNRLAEDGSLRNTAYLLHPDGRVESQDKLHLTPQEHDLGTRGGDDLLITRIGPFTTGVLICADIQFPELSRYLVHQGVDLILCPSLTWNRRGVHRVRTGCAARAMENQLYVVGSPLVGHSGLPIDAPLHAVGHALVTGPVDKIVGRNDGIMGIAESTQEEILFVDLDRDLLLASREKPEIPGLGLRRLDLVDKLR